MDTIEHELQKFIPKKKTWASIPNGTKNKITREEGESWRRKQGHWKGVSGSIGALPRTLSAMGMALEAPSPCCAARRGLRTPGWRPAAACRLSRECVCARKENEGRKGRVDTEEGRDGEEKRGGWCGVLNPDGAAALAGARRRQAWLN
jgi:hypothetical protein